jgi:hypothetical protein
MPPHVPPASASVGRAAVPASRARAARPRSHREPAVATHERTSPHVASCPWSSVIKPPEARPVGRCRSSDNVAPIKVRTGAADEHEERRDRHGRSAPGAKGGIRVRTRNFHHDRQSSIRHAMTSRSMRATSDSLT